MSSLLVDSLTLKLIFPSPSWSNILNIWSMNLSAFLLGMAYMSAMLCLSISPLGQTSMNPLNHSLISFSE